MAIDRKQAIEIIIEIGRRLWLRSYIASNDGNISVKITENEILTTVRGVSKGFLGPEEIVSIDREGNSMESSKYASSELPMHLEIYRNRPDVNAVVHAHPPVATGFAAAGLELDKSILPEVILTLGNVPLTPYGTTGTRELALIIGKAIRQHNGLLMQNHGAVTVGSDLWEAYYRMETLEHFATITLVTKILGRQSVLGEKEIKALLKKAGSTPKASNENRQMDLTLDDKKDGSYIKLTREELVEIIYQVLQKID
jgi:L-fuculose-phosphate aldolase